MHFARVKIGEIPASTAEAYRWRLKIFAEFARAECISHVLEGVIEAFSIEVRSKSRGYAIDCVRVVKQIIVWAWENRLIDDVPRNLKNRLKERRPLMNPNPMPLDQVRAFGGSMQKRATVVLRLAWAQCRVLPRGYRDADRRQLRE